MGVIPKAFKEGMEDWEGSSLLTYDKLAVEFENVSLHRATILPKTGITKFDVRVFKTSGNFVISESGTIAATGRVFVPQNETVMRFGYVLDE